LRPKATSRFAASARGTPIPGGQARLSRTRRPRTDAPFLSPSPGAGVKGVGPGRRLLASRCHDYHPQVTYDIYFVRREAGRTLLQTLEAANAGFDPDSEPEPMRLTPGQRAAWDRIVERLTRELGPATCEEFPYCLILRREGPAGVVQLDFSGKSAAISMPYRYSDRLALPVINRGVPHRHTRRAGDRARPVRPPGRPADRRRRPGARRRQANRTYRVAVRQTRCMVAAGR
jgi:hypothetical protein